MRKSLALAALAMATVPAFAADQSIDLSSGTATFASTSPVLAGGDDVLSFINLAAGTYDFLLDLTARNITGLTVTLNGQQAATTSLGRFTFAALESTGQAPFALTITGLAGARASYDGTLSVSAVPEPETYAMLLAGLGVVTMLARRRTPRA